MNGIENKTVRCVFLQLQKLWLGQLLIYHVHIDGNTTQEAQQSLRNKTSVGANVIPATRKHIPHFASSNAHHTEETF
jgi:hypothetical protein